jgi:hypothetical protein
LCLPQCLELLWTGLQFQFGCERHFHRTRILFFTLIVNTVTCVNDAPIPPHG